MMSADDGRRVSQREMREGSPNERTLRERVGALRNIPPFLRLVWQTSPPLALASLVLRLVRAFIPVATLYIGKLIIDEVVRLVGRVGADASLRDTFATGTVNQLVTLVALEFGLAIASDLLGRVVNMTESLLSERFSNTTSIRLMEHAATLDLEDFEDSELQDSLERARRQASGRTALMGQIFGQAQDVLTIASFAAGLVVYAPWLIALLVLALVPAFVGEAHFNAQS
jgi:ATP-binding cassette subfamily B protein